jgi:YHS domain-containing protein
VVISLRQKGARLGPVLAFLVATPATSIIALLVAYGLLGLKFTAFIFFGAIVMGLVMGLVGNRIESKAKVLVPPARQAVDPVCGMNVEVEKAAKTEYGGETHYFCCPHCQQAFEDGPEEYLGVSRQVAHRVKHVFRYLLHSQRSPGSCLRIAGHEYRRRNGTPIVGSHHQFGLYPRPEKSIRWQDSGCLSGGRRFDVCGSRLLFLADIAMKYRKWNTVG